jgi:hypothetical protein
MNGRAHVEPNQTAAPSADFLASTDVVDWYHPDVQTAAWMLVVARPHSWQWAVVELEGFC